MGAFDETTTERLLREERQRQKLSGLGLPTSLGGLFPKKSSLEKAIGHYIKQAKEEQQLREYADPYRYLSGTLSGAYGDPVRDQLEAIARQTGFAAGVGGSSSPARAHASLTTPAKPQGVISSAAELGPIIRKARKAMKFSQAEFAAHAGVGRRFVYELEAGKASLEFDKVLACAAAAGIDILARPRRAE
jgi:y4mF family transcriptional regulator